MNQPDAIHCLVEKGVYGIARRYRIYFDANKDYVVYANPDIEARQYYSSG